MDGRTWLMDRFERDRSRLHAVAYRMLGSHSEAEDAVQESWLRVDRAETGDVENPAAWLTTVVTRVCLNMLRTRTTRREDPLEAHLPADGGGRADVPDPEQEAVLSDSVGLAMLVVLDALAPAERVAFVLHDMFAVPFDEIGPMIDRTPAAARQLASRARRRVKGGDRPAEADLARRRRVVEAFLAASRGGDLDALVAVLHPDVVLHADAAVAPSGTPSTLRGAHNVAKGASVAAGRARNTEPGLIDGSVGLVMAPEGRLALVLMFTVVEERITRIEIVAEPERLESLEIGVLDA